MVVEFNAPLETLLNDPPAEFVPSTNQFPQVADQPPQVINEDSPAVNACGGGGTNEDDGMVQIDNPIEVLSSKDHPLGDLN